MSKKRRLKIEKLGTDPEVFLQRVGTNEVVSSIGLIGGTKKTPVSIGNGCSAHEDNVLLEFNIPPCDNAEEFYDYIKYCINFTDDSFRKDNLKVLIQPSADLKEEELNNPKALEFGCEAEFEAYNKTIIPPPDPPENLRTGGGHIHISYSGEDLSDVELKACIVKWLDLYLALPFMFVDKDDQRRELYGKAGTFRTKPYGLEYRVLSNLVISEKEYISWVFDNVKTVFNNINNGKSLTKKVQKMTRKAINTNNRKIAKELINEFGIKAPKKITKEKVS